jgi:hypothetical protein
VIRAGLKQADTRMKMMKCFDSTNDIVSVKCTCLLFHWFLA